MGANKSVSWLGGGCAGFPGFCLQLNFSFVPKKKNKQECIFGTTRELGTYPEELKLAKDVSEFLKEEIGTH